MIESQPNHDPHYTGTLYANNVQGSRRETGSQINKGEKCAKYIRGGYIQQRLNEFNIEAMKGLRITPSLPLAVFFQPGSRHVSCREFFRGESGEVERPTHKPST